MVVILQLVESLVLSQVDVVMLFLELCWLRWHFTGSCNIVGGYAAGYVLAVDWHILLGHVSGYSVSSVLAILR